MPRKSRSTAAALGVALLSAAAPAVTRAAAAPHVPVPAGQVQHTVTDITFPADKNTQRFHSLRNERWIGADAGRELVTDTTTGKVREDCQYGLTAVRCWAAPLNDGEPAAGTLSILPPNPLLLSSWVDEGRNVKVLVGPLYSVTGNTTFLGHAALTIQQTAPHSAPDGGQGTTSIIADADTYYPLWREDRLTGQAYTAPDGTKGTEDVDQVTATRTMEVIAAKGVRMTIDAHPGAKVVDFTPSASASSHRHKAHKKPKHKGYGKK